MDITTGHERGGEAIFEHHDERGFSIFRMDEVERTQKLLQATELLQTLMAEVMLRGMTRRVAVGKRALHRSESHQRSCQAQRRSTEHRV